MKTIRERSRKIPVAHRADLCVVGGSCTGVFAAVRAARLGASVALIENHGFFGGVATAGLVNIWHSLFDTAGERRIIGGLTREILERLQKRNAVQISKPGDNYYAVFNSAELILELDELVREHSRIRPFLHARMAEAVMENGRITAVIIEDKSGRRAILADHFIDASGDGDLLARAGLAFTRLKDLQPPTTCAILNGLPEVEKRNKNFNLANAVHDPRWPNALKKGLLWSSQIPGWPSARLVAGTRVHHADCSDADVLTRAEMEGRRQVRAICDILRRHYAGGDQVALASLPAGIGIRETRHALCRHRLTEKEVLEGTHFPDAIANGSYRVDIHHSRKAGLTFRYLDGAEVYCEPGKSPVRRRWRSRREKDPTFYQIPYRSLLPKKSKNLLVAGRLLDADRGAYGAVRVMVNCNQTGEAAGVACVLAGQARCSLAEIDPQKLRSILRREGVVII